MASNKKQSTPTSWRHGLLFRLVALWFILKVGLQPLVNSFKTAYRLTAADNDSHHHLLAATTTNLDQPLSNVPPTGEYSRPSNRIENSTLGSTSMINRQHSYNSSGSSNSTNATTTFMPVVVQATDIASIPPDVVNHHVVNLNGRLRLGQGEKIIVVGMPKSGTSSVTKFFQKQQKQFFKRACHFGCAIPVDANGYGTYNNKTFGRYLGVCMAEAKEKKLPLIKTCGDYEVIGQMDFSKANKCYMPQITMLQELHDEHPDATFILNLRNVHHWTSSVSRWGGMHTRLSRFCGENVGPKNAKGISLRTWYQEHTTRIRQFVADHPTHALVEIDVESPATGPRMASIFGLDEQGWVSS
jgi:Sulfotransferase domain